MLDDAWRNRFKGDDTFARVRDDARLVRSITSTQSHWFDAQLDSWMQAVLRHGDNPDGARRLCELYHWFEADTSGDRTKRFVEQYNCMPMLVRILNKHSKRALVCAIALGCLGHMSRAVELYEQIYTDEVQQLIASAFTKHVVSPNFSQGNPAHYQCMRLLLAPYAMLTRSSGMLERESLPRSMR